MSNDTLTIDDLREMVAKAKECGQPPVAYLVDRRIFSAYRDYLVQGIEPKFDWPAPRLISGRYSMPALFDGAPIYVYDEPVSRPADKPWPWWFAPAAIAAYVAVVLLEALMPGGPF